MGVRVAAVRPGVNDLFLLVRIKMAIRRRRLPAASTHKAKHRSSLAVKHESPTAGNYDRLRPVKNFALERPKVGTLRKMSARPVNGHNSPLESAAPDANFQYSKSLSLDHVCLAGQLPSFNEKMFREQSGSMVQRFTELGKLG